MQRVLVILLLVASSGCASYRSLGNQAFDDGDFVTAVSYYHRALEDHGVAKSKSARDPKLSPSEQAEILERMRTSFRAIMAPAFEDAKKLYEEGFTMLALDLAGGICQVNVAHFIESEEIVPGACNLVVEITKRLEADGAGGRPSFSNAMAIRGAIARAYSPPAVMKSFRDEILEKSKDALANDYPTHAWFWLRKYTGTTAMSFADENNSYELGTDLPWFDGPIAETFNEAQSTSARWHLAKLNELSETRPWVAQIHGAVARVIAPGKYKWGSVPAAGMVDVEPGNISGPCSKQMRDILGRPGVGTKMKVDLRIAKCTTGKTTRYKSVRKTKAYTTSKTVTVSDPVYRTKKVEVCKKVKVCKRVVEGERYWLPWKGCHQKDIETQRQCHQSTAKEIASWTKRKVKVSKKNYRTVKVKEQYETYVFTVEGKAIAYLDGQRFTFPFSVDRQSSNAWYARRAGTQDLLTILGRAQGRVEKILKARAATDPVDTIAKRMFDKEEVEPAEIADVAEATRVPAHLLLTVLSMEKWSTLGRNHRRALQAGGEHTDWNAKWRDEPEWGHFRIGRKTPEDRLSHKAFGALTNPLVALRDEELELLPDVNWLHVLARRVRPQRRVATLD